MPDLDLTVGLNADTKDFLSGLAKVRRDTQATAKSVGTAGQAVRRLNRELRGFGAAAFVLQGIKLATRNFISFSDRMLEVRAITQATADQFKDAERTVQQLGATTRFTASEAAEGFAILARAGFEVQASIEALPGILNLASSGFISVKQAADIAISAIRQFNLANKDSERVADALVATANRTKTSVDQIGITLSFAGAFAAAAGVSFEELSAATGILADAGIKASRGGTALRGILASLIDVTPKARNQLERMGLTVDQVSPAYNNFVDVLKRLKAANLDATTAPAIFRKRQLAAALVLTQNVEAYEELIKEIKAADKESKRVATTLESGLGGAFRRLRSAIEATNISIGTSGFAKALQEVTEFTTQVFRALADVPGTLASVSDSAKLVADTIRNLIKVIGVMLSLRLIAWLTTLAIAFGKTALAAGGLFSIIRRAPFFLAAAGAVAFANALSSVTTAAEKQLAVAKGAGFRTQAQFLLGIDDPQAAVKEAKTLAENVFAAFKQERRRQQRERSIIERQAQGDLTRTKSPQDFLKTLAGGIFGKDILDTSGTQFAPDLITAAKELLRATGQRVPAGAGGIAALEEALGGLVVGLKEGTIGAGDFLGAIEELGDTGATAFKRAAVDSDEFLSILQQLRVENEALNATLRGAPDFAVQSIRIQGELQDSLTNEQKERLNVLLQENIELQKQADLLEEAKQISQQLTNTLADVFSNFFQDITDGVNSIKEALENLVRSLISQLSKLLFDTALQRLFSGFLNPQTFTGFGRIPTSTGVGGAAGPTFNLPPTVGVPPPTPFSNVGFGNEGLGGGQSFSFPPTTVIVNTPDADSFRRSRRQIAQAIDRTTARARG